MTYKLTYLHNEKPTEFWCSASCEDAARCIFHASAPERMGEKVTKVEKMPQ